MDFFNSLPLDLKMLAVGIAGCTLLALFSGNRKSEKRYMLVLALLAAGGVYRFTHLPASESATAEASAPKHFIKAPDNRTPLVSTSAR